MGLFDFIRGMDINQGVDEWKNNLESVLIDVRTREEYSDGHIPGSINIPLNEIDTIIKKIPKKDTQLFVHCLSGARSSQATAHLGQLGYTTVKNIGGINRYKGKVEV